MAKRITMLLTDKELREKMGIRAREKVIRDYSVIKMVHEYESAYFDLISNDLQVSGEAEL
jgi:glycosyltransferase involved in cell wall biosynthesis